jgi:DNA-binding PadR family transcriptional regulator
MPVRHTMLGLLSWKPMHGYLLRQHAQAFDWIYPMTNANIYPALHSLEKDGLVKHESEIHEGRARKVYSITQAGIAELRRWLADDAPQKLTFRDTLLLKISMMGDRTMEKASGWIEREAEELRDEIERNDLAVKREPLPKYTKLVMEYGIDLLRLRLRFFERVLDAGGQPASG